MPITSSAKKALRVSKRKRVINLATKASVDAPMKQFRKLIADKKVAEATALVSKLFQALDKGAKGGYLKKNTASRKKSRIAAALKRAGK